VLEIKVMLRTVGVLSVLEGAALDEARRLWRLFETVYASKGVQSFDHPNVTFQGGQCRDVARLDSALLDLNRQLRAFEIIIDGLGYFEVCSNVVFLKVQPTEELRRINRAVNDVLRGHCDELFEYCLPRKWVPHVTVAMEDLTDENLERVKKDLGEYHPYYRQVLSNIHLVQRCEDTGRIEILRSYSCG
jgi:2'-5' RNA ligase